MIIVLTILVILFGFGCMFAYSSYKHVFKSYNNFLHVLTANFAFRLNDSLLFMDQKSAETPNTTNDDQMIIGGWETTIENYPFIVSVGIGVNHHKCGGSIISDCVVVSAAHCYSKLSDIDHRRLYIRAGSAFWMAGGSRIPVASVRVHERYNSETKANDIALLYLRAPLIFHRNIQPIPLADDNFQLYPFDELLVAGWGTRQQTHDDYPPNLHAVMVNYVALAICQSVFRGFEPRKIDYHHICAGNMMGGRDACQVNLYH